MCAFYLLGFLAIETAFHVYCALGKLSRMCGDVMSSGSIWHFDEYLWPMAMALFKNMRSTALPRNCSEA